MEGLTELPANFMSGTTVEYRRTLSDFPANDGWALEATISGGTRDDGTAFKIVAKAADGDGTVTADGADFLVTFPAAATAKLGAGLHTWVELATKAGVTKLAARDTLTVELNPATAYPGAAQSYNERVLALLRCKLEDRAAKGKSSIVVDDNAITWDSVDDLLKLIAMFESRVAAERRGGPRKPVLAAFTPLGYDR